MAQGRSEKPLRIDTGLVDRLAAEQRYRYVGSDYLSTDNTSGLTFTPSTATTMPVYTYTTADLAPTNLPVKVG